MATRIVHYEITESTSYGACHITDEGVGRDGLAILKLWNNSSNNYSDDDYIANAPIASVRINPMHFTIGLQVLIARANEYLRDGN